jgi:heptaprenyl diphosphate synthase
MTASTRSYAETAPVAGGVARSATTHALTTAALLMALASVLGLLEASLPVPIPGARLGLANVAVVLALVMLGPSRALVVSLGRVAIVSLAAGTAGGPIFMLAVAGAFASWAGMCLVMRLFAGATVVGISAAGGVVHVFSQLAVASLLAGTASVFAVGTVSLSAGLLFGIATGLIARLVISRMQEFVHPGT